MNADIINWIISIAVNTDFVAYFKRTFIDFIKSFSKNVIIPTITLNIIITYKNRESECLLLIYFLIAQNLDQYREQPSKI